MKFNIKFKFLLTLLIAFSLLTPTLYAGVKLGTDSGGQDWFIVNVIRNSNGNYWAPSIANIRTALWDLNATGGTVYVPAASYSVTGSDETHIIHVNEVDNLEVIFDRGAVFTPENDFRYNIFRFSNCSNLHISGGVFNGQSATVFNHDDKWGNFLSLSNVSFGVIEDVYGFNISTGLIVADGLNKTTISNIHVDRWRNDSYPIHLHGYPHDVVSPWAGINIDVLIEDCQLYNNLSHGDDNAAGIACWGQNERTIIRDNHIERPGEFGIYVYEAFPPFSTNKTIIADNMVLGARYGIRFFSANEECILSNNFVNCSQRGFDLNGNCSIINNICIGGRYAVVWVNGGGIMMGNQFLNQTYRNVHLSKVNDTVVSGNRFACDDSTSVRVDNCLNIEIDDNFLTDQISYTGTNTFPVNHGVATILNGQDSVVVTHGLSYSPSFVLLTGNHSEVSAAWVTSITTTLFTINVTAAVTFDRLVYWYAERDPFKTH